jgi:hypothetical protein
VKPSSPLPGAAKKPVHPLTCALGHDAEEHAFRLQRIPLLDSDSARRVVDTHTVQPWSAFARWKIDRTQSRSLTVFPAKSKTTGFTELQQINRAGR